MKSMKIALLAAAAAAALGTSAYADNDAASRQAYLLVLNGQPAAQTIVEGRQSAAAAVNQKPSAADQLLIDLAVKRNQE